jgi:hypothetical protein
VASFLGQNDSGFERLDAGFVRVIEDVIDTLIARNVINITDLPDQAQAKLFATTRAMRPVRSTTRS